MGAETNVPVTDELLKALDDGSKQMSDLPPETRAEVTKLIIEGKEGPDPVVVEKLVEKPAETVETKVEVKAGEKPVEPTVEKPVEKEPTPADAKAKRKENSRLREEIAEYEEKNRQLVDRKAKLKADLDAAAVAPIKKPEDLLDDTAQTTILKRLEKLEKENEALKKDRFDSTDAEIKTLEKRTTKARGLSVFEQMADMQDLYPALKTSKPVEALNQEYSDFTDRVILATGVKNKTPDADYNKLVSSAMAEYEADPALQAKIPAPKEWEKLNLLLTANHRAATQGGSFRAHLLEVMDDEGILSKTVERQRQEAAGEAARETVRALKKPESEVSVLAPGEGASVAGDSQSDEKLLNGLFAKQKLGRLNDAEKQQLREAHARLIGRLVESTA